MYFNICDGWRTTFGSLSLASDFDGRDQKEERRICKNIQQLYFYAKYVRDLQGPVA